MKTTLVFLALLLGVVLNVVAGSGNVATKDTVNGWYFWKAEGSGSDTTYTRLTSKCYEGKSAQLFGNIAKNSETSYDWRKDLSKSYAFPKFVLAELYLESIKLESSEDSLNIADIEFYVGNKKNPTILYRMSRSGASYTELKWKFLESLPFIDSTIARPDSVDFVVIRLCYFGNTNPGAEFIVDYMRFVYGGPLKIDSSIIIDRFGDPDPVKLSPGFFVSSRELDFDSTAVGDIKSLPLILGNSGNDTLIFTSIAETSNEFVVDSIPQRIRPSDSVVVRVKFKPNASGKRSGYVLFAHNAAMKLDSVFVSGFGKNLMRVDVKKEGLSPNDFRLEQNYPNPFNPSTTIEFSLPSRANVNLAVYNTIGQKVETLASSEMGPGNHKVSWNAAGVPSGTYIYRLIADNSVVETKKMLLMK